MKYTLQSKPWYILGAGAMGCLWAYRLQQQGIAVQLLLRNGSRLAQYRQAGGVSIADAAAEEPPRFCAPAQIAATCDQAIEQLIISCKAQQTDAAFSAVAAQVDAAAEVILLQNGMGVAEQLQQRHPGLQLHAAVTTSGVHTVAPFRVRQAGHGQTQLGRFPRDPEGTAPDASLARRLNSAALPVTHCANIYRAQWQKLAVNCVINPLTALYRVRNGDLLRHPAAASEARALCDEICAVSQAIAMPLSATQLRQRVIAVCAQTADNISSMLQDVRAGRDTEIDYINGYLQHKAREHGIGCPTNASVLQRVHALQSAFPPPSGE